VRESNQDRLIAFRAGPSGSDSPFACVAISDGMGRMVDGEACALLTVATLAVHLIAKRRVPLSERLDAAARAANKAAFRHASGRGGATLSALVFGAYGHIWFANVGDSRIYAVTQDRRAVVRLTIDETMEEAFADTAGIWRDVLRSHRLDEPRVPARCRGLAQSGQRLGRCVEGSGANGRPVAKEARRWPHGIVWTPDHAEEGFRTRGSRRAGYSACTRRT
jgi:serine/threonine protein phosphatase PrpC